MLKATHVNGGWTVMLASIIATGGFASIFILFYGILSLIDDSDHHAWSTTKALGFKLPGAKHRGYSHTILFNLLLWYAIYAWFKYFYPTIGDIDLYVLLGISLSHLLYDAFTKRRIPAFAPSIFFVIPLLVYVFYYKIINGGIDVNDWAIFDVYVIGGIAIFALIIEKVILINKLKWISKFLNTDCGIPIFSTGSAMEKIFTFINSFINLGLLGYIIWKYIVPGTLIVPTYDSKMILIALGFNIFVSYLLFKDELKYFSKNVTDTIKSMFQLIINILINVVVVWGIIWLNQKFNIINFNALASSLNLAFIQSGEIIMYILCAIAMIPSIMLALKNFESSWFKIAAASNIVIMISTFWFFFTPFIKEFIQKFL